MGNLVGGKCLAAFLPSSNVESVLCLQPLSEYCAMREGKFYLVGVVTMRRSRRSSSFVPLVPLAPLIWGSFERDSNVT